MVMIPFPLLSFLLSCVLLYSKFYILFMHHFALVKITRKWHCVITVLCIRLHSPFQSVDSSHNPHHLCLVSYRLSAGFTPVLSSHGNAKEYSPFHPTWPSTLKRVKEESISSGPKETVERVSSEMGGVLGASAPGQLPRNERRVTNQKRMQKEKGSRQLSQNSADKHTHRILLEILFET